jgi:hypothetical protein
MRERLYGGISALSLLVVYAHESDVNAWTAAATLLITALALWGTAFIAEYVAHTAEYGRLPTREVAFRTLTATYQIVEASAIPVLLLCAAGLGLISTSAALLIGRWLLVASLGVFAFLAVWRTELAWSRKLIVVAAVLLLGVVVVLVKSAIH